MSGAVSSASTDLKGASGSAKPRHALAIVILAAAVLIVYMPANGRFFAADHLFYLAELRGSRSMSDGLALTDYSLNRVYWRGDDLLHRPALFAWLALANTLFHHDFTTWNMANFCLHVLVVLAMYKLLWTLQPSRLAFWLALLFAVSRGSSELVLWHHLGGYLIAYLLILIALIAAVRIYRGEGEGGYGGPVACFVALFASALFYEIAVPLAFLLAGMFVLRWRTTRSRQAIWAAAGCLLAAVGYLVTYVIHCFQVPNLLWVGDGGRTGPTAVIVAFANAGFSLLADNLVPWTFIDGVRHQQRPLRNAIDWPFSRAAQAVLVMVGLLLLLLKGFKWNTMRQRLPFAGVLVLIIAIYLLLISYGRTSIAVRNGYYAYFLTLVGIPLVYSLLDPSRFSKRHLNVVIGVLVAATVVNAALVYAQGQRYSTASRGADVYFGSVATFIDVTKSEPGFSFSVESGDPELDPQIRLIIGHPSAPKGEITPNLSEILFMRYYDPVKPKYRLFYRPGEDQGTLGKWFVAGPGSSATLPSGPRR